MSARPSERLVHMINSIIQVFPHEVNGRNICAVSMVDAVINFY